MKIHGKPSALYVLYVGYGQTRGIKLLGGGLKAERTLNRRRPPQETTKRERKIEADVQNRFWAYAF
ncbi:MAG: hypothetical protein EBU90_21365 [Proteobacteria bacterium]|nr:hypothetical protein [Pseudomonadota bacterium]